MIWYRLFHRGRPTRLQENDCMVCDRRDATIAFRRGNDMLRVFHAETGAEDLVFRTHLRERMDPHEARALFGQMAAVAHVPMRFVRSEGWRLEAHLVPDPRNVLDTPYGFVLNGTNEPVRVRSGDRFLSREWDASWGFGYFRGTSPLIARNGRDILDTTFSPTPLTTRQADAAAGLLSLASSMPVKPMNLRQFREYAFQEGP